MELLIPWEGTNTMSFWFEGVRFRRGGAYEPVLDMVHGGYADEALLWFVAIDEMSHEIASRTKRDTLLSVFEDLERSAGRRPPRRR